MRPRTFLLLVAVSVLPLAGCGLCPCCKRDRPPVRDRIRDDRPIPPPDLRSGAMSPQASPNGAIPVGNPRPTGAYGGSQ